MTVDLYDLIANVCEYASVWVARLLNCKSYFKSIAWSNSYLVCKELDIELFMQHRCRDRYSSPDKFPSSVRLLEDCLDDLKLRMFSHYTCVRIFWYVCRKREQSSPRDRYHG